MVAPWHPKWNRPKIDRGVHFHLFRYAPVQGMNTFGYAEGMRADVRLKRSAVAVAPLALLAGWFKALRVAQKKRATIVHAHWVIPGGVIGAAAAGSTPLVISLHGSDVFVAERHAAARLAARAAFKRSRWVTACSEDLRARAVAIGAQPDRSNVIPYGVDSERFKPDADSRARGRKTLGVADNVPLVFAVGRLVKKKGFEYLIDAAAVLKAEHPQAARSHRRRGRSRIIASDPCTRRRPGRHCAVSRRSYLTTSSRRCLRQPTSQSRRPSTTMRETSTAFRIP